MPSGSFRGMEKIRAWGGIDAFDRARIIASLPNHLREFELVTKRRGSDLALAIVGQDAISACLCVPSADLPYLHKTALNIHLYTGMFGGLPNRKMRAVPLSRGGWQRGIRRRARHIVS